jgi:phage protein D
VTALSFTLLVNDSPAGDELLASLQQIEVEDNANLADMMRIRVGVAVNEQGTRWTLVDEELFPRLAKLRLLVTIGALLPEALIETRVIETNVSFANDPSESVLNVVAMDPTVLMNLEEKVRAWPNMADSDIATTIFGEHGAIPDVEGTQPTRQEIDTTTMQRGTDIQFLRQLATRNGYECYLELEPLTGLLMGHFHPPRVDQRPQGVLSVNMSDATNVNSFTARYDMLRPTAAEATGVDIESQEDKQGTADSAALKALGSMSAVGGDNPRRVLLSRLGTGDAGELQALAQAVVDQSSLAITADGDLHTAAYGGILRAKRPVLVRGAGEQFSGTYYVEQVLHTLTPDSYTQRFTLRRNALGLMRSEDFAGVGAG